MEVSKPEQKHKQVLRVDMTPLNAGFWDMRRARFCTAEVDKRDRLDSFDSPDLTKDSFIKLRVLRLENIEALLCTRHHSDC